MLAPGWPAPAAGPRLFSIAKTAWKLKAETRDGRGDTSTVSNLEVSIMFNFPFFC